MSKAIMVTSFKGGVGKTVFSSALAYAAATSGQRAVGVDMDFESGGLDIALGAENSLGASVLDVLRGSADCERAQICCGGIPELNIISSPMTLFEDLGDITPQMMDDFILRLKLMSDLVIFDMPAGGGEFFTPLASSKHMDGIIVVTTDSPTAVRSAEKCGIGLAGIAKCPVRLVINAYGITPSRNTRGLLDLIGDTAIRAIGVIPFDKNVPRCIAQGRPVTSLRKSPAAVAVRNVLARLDGENVPLLCGIAGKRKRNKLY